MPVRPVLAPSQTHVHICMALLLRSKCQLRVAWCSGFYDMAGKSALVLLCQGTQAPASQGQRRPQLLVFPMACACLMRAQQHAPGRVLKYAQVLV